MLRDLYAQEWEHFRKDYKKGFWILTFVSLVIAVVFYMLIVKNPQTVKELLTTLAQAFEAKGIKSGGTPTNFFWSIFKNNTQATLLSVVIGIIPLIVLPAFSGIITISTISILLASVAIQNQPWIDILVYGILPHGIIEMIAIFLSGSVGIFLSLTVFRRLFSRNRHQYSVKNAILQSLKTYILVILPLVLLAALIEGYVTPILIHKVV
ncbi:stage II sporulation protein M [Brevibacillus laterosporus]|uniref:Stage II sporulation protein M n=1 Tax=Brevibacillus laterosporus TaxID=1465 RepID=A0A0F7EH78_BRELA|nr:stage II sporulation protein M [Brevibacillus halotolerans]AKF94485.1 hypothetical protein EX87_13200 [Brevibacillus laterosporus]GIO00817.1 membrane protein [Brevibacillus halotolerans]